MIRIVAVSTFLVFANYSPSHAQLVWTANLDSVNSFSSPRVEDLNNDGVADLVIGGATEGSSSDLGVVALNGVDGSILWTTPARSQMFASAIFMNLNGVGAKDVVMAGRDAQLLGIDGDNGSLMWEVYSDTSLLDSIGRHNFYTGQPIPDQDNDNISDIIVAFGGGEAGEEGPNEGDRPPGHIMVISGLSGNVLAKMVVPDSAETFSSLVVNEFGTNELWAVYGTGGETLPGGLWRTSLSDVLAELPFSSELLHSNDSNGYVAPPSLVDLTGDGIVDIVLNNHAGEVVAINGETGTLIWNRSIDNGEASSSPCIGKFNADATPDIVTIMAIGIWPHYTDYIRLTLDGLNGNTIDSTSLVDWNLSSMLACDLNADGIDEIISAFDSRHYNSVMDTMIYTVTVEATDPTNWTTVFEYGPETGANSFYTPLLADIDDNGMADIVYVSTEDSLFFISENRMVIRRLELPMPSPPSIAWGNYMGTQHDGTYHPSSMVSGPSELGNGNPTPLHFPGQLFNSVGEVVASTIRAQIQLDHALEKLPCGLYIFKTEGQTDAIGHRIVNSGRQ